MWFQFFKYFKYSWYSVYGSREIDRKIGLNACLTPRDYAIFSWRRHILFLGMRDKTRITLANTCYTINHEKLNLVFCRHSEHMFLLRQHSKVVITVKLHDIGHFKNKFVVLYSINTFAAHKCNFCATHCSWSICKASYIDPRDFLILIILFKQWLGTCVTFKYYNQLSDCWLTKIRTR